MSNNTSPERLDREEWPTLKDSLTRDIALASNTDREVATEIKLCAQYNVMPNCAKDWSFIVKGRTMQHSFSLAFGVTKPICLECRRFQGENCRMPWCIKFKQAYMESRIPDNKWALGEVFYFHVASRGYPDDIGYFTSEYSSLSRSYLSDFLITQVTVAGPLGWDRTLCLNNMVIKKLTQDIQACSCPGYMCPCITLQSSEVPTMSYAPIDLDEITCILKSSEVMGRLKAYVKIPCNLLRRAYQHDISRRAKQGFFPLLRAIRRGIIEAHVRCYDEGYVSILTTEIDDLKDAVKSLRLS